MKLLATLFTIVASLTLAAPTLAASKAASESVRSDSIWLGGYGRLHSWSAVSQDELILWASPSRAYLVKIWRPSRSLRFARSIGVTSTVGRISKFENVIVDRQRLPIKSIVAIDRDTAKSMRWKRKQS